MVGPCPAKTLGGFVARLILPVISLGIVQAAIMTRYVRSAVLDVMDEDFMRTARAKGLNPGQALMAHGLRNAALPVLTVTGLQITNLLIGAVVIEKVSPDWAACSCRRSPTGTCRRCKQL